MIALINCNIALPSNTAVTADEQWVLSNINAMRNGVPLRIDDSLNRAAQYMADELVPLPYLTKEDFAGRLTAERANNCGAMIGYFAEIQVGNSNQAHAFNEFMKAPEVRDHRFTHVGIAHTSDVWILVLWRQY